jgi:hypothetical protein
LLGQLSPDEQRTIEQQTLERRLLDEDELFEELEIAEDELMAEYLSGKLSEPESAAFKKHFMKSPERQRHLKSVQTLNRNFHTFVPLPWWNTESHFLRAAAAIAVVSVLAGIVWMLRTGPTPAPVVATFTLTISSAERSPGADPTGAETFSIKAGADKLSILLLLPQPSKPASRYRAVLIDGKGEIKPLEVTGTDARSVSVAIAAKLPPGQFAIQLSAVKPDGTEERIPGSYFFTLK